MIDARRGRLEEAIEKLGGMRARPTRPTISSRWRSRKSAPFARSSATTRPRPTPTAKSWRSIRRMRWPGWRRARHITASRSSRRAGEAYTHVTGLEPENPIPWHNLGLLAADQNQNEQARDYFQREVDLAPGDAKAWYDLAVAWEKLGNEDEAANAFAQAESLVSPNIRKTSDPFRRHEHRAPPQSRRPGCSRRAR